MCTCEIIYRPPLPIVSRGQTLYQLQHGCITSSARRRKGLVSACAGSRCSGMQFTPTFTPQNHKSKLRAIIIASGCLAMENCFCCGKSVASANEKKRKRPLSSPGISSALECLTALMSRFPEVDCTTGYICRSCSDRLQTLTNNLQSALAILPKF